MLYEVITEHDIGHGEGQHQVEALSADIEDQRFAAFEILGQFTEIGGQTDCGKGKGKEPATEQAGAAADNALINHGATQILPQVGIDQREDDGCGHEAEYEFGETMPDLAA